MELIPSRHVTHMVLYMGVDNTHVIIYGSIDSLCERNNARVAWAWFYQNQREVRQVTTIRCAAFGPLTQWNCLLSPVGHIFDFELLSASEQQLFTGIWLQKSSWFLTNKGELYYASFYGEKNQCKKHFRFFHAHIWFGAQHWPHYDLQVTTPRL